MVVSARGIRTLSREERTDYAFLESYYLAPQGRTGAGAELPGDMRLRRITRPARIESRSTSLRKKLAFLQRRTLHGERYRLLQLLREFETHPARFGGHTPLALTPELIGNNNEVMDVIHIDSGSNYSNGSINTNKVVVILNEKEFEDDKVFTTAPVNTNTGVTIKSDDKDNSTKLIANTESVVQIKSEDEDGRTRLRNTNERTASTNAGDGSEKSSTDSYDKVITTKIENKDDNDKNERGSISISNHDIAATSKRNVTAIKTENEDEDDYTTNKRYKTSTDNTNEVTAFKYENEDNSNTEGGSPIATNNYKMVAIKKEDEDEDENGNTKNEGYNIFINNNEDEDKDENVAIKMENEDDNNTEGSSNESINDYISIAAMFELKRPKYSMRPMERVYFRIKQKNFHKYKLKRHDLNLRNNMFSLLLAEIVSICKKDSRNLNIRLVNTALYDGELVESVSKRDCIGVTFVNEQLSKIARDQFALISNRTQLSAGEKKTAILKFSPDEVKTKYEMVDTVNNSYSIQDRSIRDIISSSSPSISPSLSITRRNCAFNKEVMCDDDDKDKSNNNSNNNSKDVQINNNDNDYYKEERSSTPIYKVVSATATKTSIEEVKMCFKCGTKKKVCYYYNNMQWKKSTGSGFCKDCRDNLTVEQMRKIKEQVKMCIKCGTEKREVYYNKIQWMKRTGSGFCKDCHDNSTVNLVKQMREIKAEQVKMCIKCGTEKQKLYHNNEQWTKVTGSGFCIDCCEKVCKKCGEGKKKTFYLKSQWMRISGYGVCKICVCTSHNEQNKKDATAVMTTHNGIVVDGTNNKVCIDCGEAKDKFSYTRKQRRMPSGFGSCGECSIINQRLSNWEKKLLNRRSKKQKLDGEVNTKVLISPEEWELQSEKFRQETKEERKRIGEHVRQGKGKTLL